MSQRSIVEVNHDFSDAIDNNPITFISLLMRALHSGSDESWKPLRAFGIKRVVQTHHSTDRKVVLSGPGWTKEYPTE